MNRKKGQDYVWNTIGSLAYALNSIILSMTVVQLLGPEQGGIFSIAYTISQTLMVVGCFEMRVFQVTDRGKYSFQEYFHSRIYTAGLMIFISIVWILIKRFESEKAIATFILCLYKLSDVFGDVIEGYFQQTNRLYISGRLLTVRIAAPTLIFIVSILLTRHLLFSCLMLMLSSLCFLVVFDFFFLVIKNKVKVAGGNFNTSIKLLTICAPLFLSNFLSVYITNAPKYAIDKYLTSDMQTYYNVIFMPSFAINLLSGFVFKPFLVDFSLIWEKRMKKKILSVIAKMTIWIIAIVVSGIILGWIVGIPILSLLYGLNGLGKYRKMLIAILIGGGINAYNIVEYYFLTVMREQKYVLGGYIFVFFEAVILSNLLVKKLHIQGAVISYLICVLSLGLIFALKILHNIKTLREIDEI